jgi:ATP-grasp in the biosynthetic pathway with Ter operon
MRAGAVSGALCHKPRSRASAAGARFRPARCRGSDPDRFQHPIDAGRSGTYVETIEQDEVEELAYRLLKSLKYTGVIEVEFKHDRCDGQYKLLDINGRFWNWVGLGALAGVDFPYLAWGAWRNRGAGTRADRDGVDAHQPRRHRRLRGNIEKDPERA